MPVARVQLPDGTIGRYEVPEGTPPADVEAFAQDNWRPSVSDTMSTAGRYIGDTLKSASSGVIKGATNLLGMPADAANFVTDKLAQFGGRDPGSRIPVGGQDIRNIVGSLTGRDLYKPQTEAGKWAEPVAEGVTSMAGSGPGGLILGGISGALGEVGDRAIGGAGRLLGNVSPMALSALYALTPKGIVRSLQKTLQESGPELEAAATRKAAGDAALGVPTLLSHYTDQAGPLAAVAQEVAGSPAGGKVREALVNERKAMAEAVQRVANGPAAGEVGLPARAQVFNAGAAARGEPAASLKEATGPKYAAASSANADVAQIAQDLLAVAEKKNLTGTPAGDAITKVAGRIENMPPGVLNVNELAKQLSMQGRAKVLAGKPGGAGLTAAGQTIKAAVHEASPELTVADAAHAMGQELSVNPMKQGAIGESFPAPMVKSGKGDWSTMSKVINDPLATRDDITALAAGLNAHDPQAFPLLVKRSFLEAGHDASPTQFVKKVAGEPGSVDFPQQRAGFLEKIYQTHLANGASHEDAMKAAQGAGAVADAINSVGKGQQAMPASVQTGIVQKAGETITGDLIKVFHPESFLSRWFFINKLSENQKQRVMGQIADAFTSPDALDKLKEIAAFSMKDNAMEKILRAVNSIEVQNAPGN